MNCSSLFVIPCFKCDVVDFFDASFKSRHTHEEASLLRSSIFFSMNPMLLAMEITYAVNISLASLRSPYDAKFIIA